MTYDTGYDRGTALNSDRQLWSVSSYISLVYRVLFGMNLTGHARVALTAGTAAQLVVDAAGLVALGADDAESPGGEHLLLLRVADLAGAGKGVGAVGRRWDGAARLLVALLGVHVEPALAQQVLGEHVRLAAQADVGTAAGHVGGDGDGAKAPGLGHDMRLALVVLGVQRLVLDASLVQKPRELLGVLDGHGADQARLALRVDVYKRQPP